MALYGITEWMAFKDVIYLSDMAKIKIVNLDTLKLNRSASYDTPEVEETRTILCAEIRDGVKYFKRKLSASTWTDLQPAPVIAWEIAEEWRLAIDKTIAELDELKLRAAEKQHSRIDMIIGGRRKVIANWVVEREAILQFYSEAFERMDRRS